MTNDDRIDQFIAHHRGCADCGKNLSQYCKSARRCRTCSAKHRHTLAAATTRKNRPVTAKQIVEYLADHAPKSYQSIVAKILKAREQ